MRFTTLTIGTLALAALAAAPAQAQESRRERERREQREREEERARDERDKEKDKSRKSSSTWYATDESERAVMGINTSSSGERDTLGLLITNVTQGSPAEKAGLEEGQRIAEINGVNLKMDAADAGESDMNGIASRRLTREMRKVRPGDEVELRVWQSGRFNTVRIKTIPADELNENSYRFSRDMQRDEDERAVVGLTLNSTGSKRDTLGALIVRVEEDGPAERAGLVEGDRIQTINGVDLRVPREDAGDQFISSAKSNRFSRELRKLNAGDKVELRVYSGGSSRTVTVTTMAYEDLYKKKGGRRYGVFFGGGYSENGPNAIIAMPAVPPMPPMPAIAPMPSVRAYAAPRINGQTRIMTSPRIQRLRVTEAPEAEDDVNVDVNVDTDVLSEDVRRAVEERLRAAEVRIREAQERAGQAIRRARLTDLHLEPVLAPAAASGQATTVEASAEGTSEAQATIRALQARVQQLEAQQARTRLPAAMTSMTREMPDVMMDRTPSPSRINLPGLVLAPVNSDLAAYLGHESMDGLMVLEADRQWAGLNEGDVILSVDGECVLQDDASSLRDSASHKVEVIRGGKRQTVEVAAR